MYHHETIENITSFLPQIKIFESLPAEILYDIAQSVTRSNTYTLSKDAIFQTPSNERNGLFFVISGKLRFYKTNSAGKQHTVCILSEGGIFGEVDTFSLGARGTYVETMEDSIVFWIPTEQFEPLLSRHSELSLRFLAKMSKRLREQDELIEKLVFRDLRGKVLYFLNRLSNKFSTEKDGYRKIDIPLTHQELADMIGATREAVSLTLKELSNEGILVTGRRTIMIHTEKARKELA
ncbi:cyclic nucleotide-binding protein [Saccharibacillus kuerlensis]|uniref:Cyclic nucleotide-binding protein n=2 Tax=Saccharibacillus kuerlensis TaxID=459527 RepID=A0ABQ2L365_9BACL|nr:Crp/Fnr family transcriptional regulator [Saccharibacillus kuerlensis]GGO01012.1 cyclic nucleotide-binding protein [Saccharibacillus kuerlensis]